MSETPRNNKCRWCRHEATEHGIGGCQRCTCAGWDPIPAPHFEIRHEPTEAGDNGSFKRFAPGPPEFYIDGQPVEPAACAERFRECFPGAELPDELADVLRCEATAEAELAKLRQDRS